MHNKKYFTRPINTRGIKDHYSWLQEIHGKPIYMLNVHEEAPDSVEYPLAQITDKFFKNVRKGDAKLKYFTSTMPYMSALALYEGFDRIEIYGMDMTGPDEYVRQKPCGEYWLGMIMGAGKELYLPPNNQLLTGGLYGYQGLLR